ncbi:UNVERIFIED_CONTAM: hypothetical protein Slati_1946500 [Sesamum latifolium]|uniref:Retrovirus-related Pol polyprotein from transposon TNT 1-94-like beta-barrel domain-containing protein n=1 Tax=Sesamum latifolium TaxID=2727402 RepID=A0AAW2X5L4_9LAMI
MTFANPSLLTLILILLGQNQYIVESPLYPLLTKKQMFLPQLYALQLWKDALFDVTSMVGIPLQLDEYTVNQATLTYAKVCIKVDLNKPILAEFIINIEGEDIVQRVVYEHISRYCRLCKHIEHKEYECYIKELLVSTSGIRASTEACNQVICDGKQFKWRQHLTTYNSNLSSEEGVAANALKDLKKKDAKALFFIQQAVDNAVFSSRISAATKAKEAWDALRNGYQGTTKVLTVKLQTLRRQFESFRMKKGESVHDCSNNLMVIVNQMRKYGEKITDQTVVEKLLQSLTRKYESTVTTIEESKNLIVMTIDELLGSLQSHEDRHKSYEENSTEHVFRTKLKFTKETNGGHERSGSNYNRGGSSYREVWYMDSGSSSHMTANSEVFISLDRSAKTRIKMADGTIHNTEGKGMIMLNSGEGSCIKDVLYVLDLDSNLLSVGQFLREGYSPLFVEYSCTVFTD